MKRLLLLALIFLLPNTSGAQHVSSEIFSRSVLVTLDSTDTKKVYVIFYSPKAPKTGLVGLISILKSYR